MDLIILCGVSMNHMKNLSIIQVVGHKHSGKTTLIKKLLLNVTSKLSVQVATLKHHGHGGEPDIVQGTDSYEHLQAGAHISGVQGEDRLQLKMTGFKNADLEKIISIYKGFPIDLLLIEGYKHAPYPKIVLINDYGDEQLLQLENIIAVGGWERPVLNNEQYPTFSINQFTIYQHFFHRLINDIKRRTTHE